jgi:zinc protease
MTHRTIQLLAASALAASTVSVGLAEAQAIYTPPAETPALSATSPDLQQPPSGHVATKQVYTAPTALIPVVWPYTNFGKPGAVVGRHDDPLLGTTTITFAGGTRLIIKPTKSRTGVVDIDIAVGTGRAGAPSALAHALWATALMPIGGTGKVSYGELDKWQQTSGKSVNITFVPGIRAYHLQGEVPATELETEMQLLTAYVRDPGFRDEQIQKVATIAPLMEAQIESSPSSLFLRTVQRALLGPESKYAEVPTQQDLAATTGSELAGLLKPALAGPADITIVGDITFADAIAATGLTIAADDNRPANSANPALPAAAPTASPHFSNKPIVVYHSNDAYEAWYGAYWPLADYEADPRGAIVVEVAAALIQANLLKEEPPTQGLVRPVVRAANSLELHNGSALGIALQIHPEEAKGLEERLVRIVRLLANAPIDTEGLKSARMMVLAAHSSEQKTNAWWLTRLSLVLRNPQLEPALSAAGNITTVTAQDVQTFLRHSILPRRPIVVEVLPQVSHSLGEHG